MSTAPTVQQQQIEYLTGFAPQIAPYAERLLGSAESTLFEYARDANGNVITDASGMPKIAGFKPYMQYQGDRFAQFTPLQQQAFAGAQAMEAAPQLRDASAMLGTAGLRALGYDQYQPGQFANFYRAPEAYRPTSFTAPNVSARDLKTYQMGPAERVSTESFARPGSAESFMSPYMQSVVDIEKREAQRQSDIARQQEGARFARAGAFGGARQAIVEAERARNLGTQMGDIQSRGLQQAYQQAQQQFNAEQAARIQAQLANQQAGLTTGQQNLAAQLGVQQLGSQQGLQAALANQQALMQAQQQAEQSRQFGYGQQMAGAGLGAQYGQAAAQLGEQSRQYGAGLGLQGLQAAMQAGQGLGNIGQTQFGQNMAINQLQNQYGQQQQQQAQNILGAQYQDFLNAQNYPFRQMGFVSDVIRGVPLTQTGTSVYGQAPSTVSQIAGLGTAALGASKLFGGFARGGKVEDVAYREKPAGLADLAIYNMGR
jgi:hypothetical protein